MSLQNNTCIQSSEATTLCKLCNHLLPACLYR